MERSRSYSEKSSSTTTTPAGAVTELRCYSASYATPKKAAGTTSWPPCTTASSSTSAAAAGSKARSWSGSFRSAPAELRRKRRVAGYRVYGVEGKMKVSLKNGVRWLKGKCTQVVDGIW
ncbi:hypothetical protein CFC21_110112 [Triticum aestivum]|uniref:Uncharacterized protein n=4 Tax=Triticinae TaxID=1648030 RepID=A0A453SCZ1_AEGTS|nr:uncharacterized protein LOC109768470 [Aegilops tauschii subsp. strangulata]XP_044437032.1 uncharacterized protein LOC123163740 [Triticum aestivum]KAF7109927.1 hypothetical protein CFC21_110112 [Triticum aestivum]